MVTITELPRRAERRGTQAGHSEPGHAEDGNCEARDSEARDTAPRHASDPGADETPRWMPVRAGIMNVWRYYDETFSFDNGRLLLRGPNGSGKSKALEVLLPFLFDANLRANRLSTFGTSERTMHWNLMGDGYEPATRVGFVWLEFGRGEGEKRAWFTCGARLQASKHTSTVQPDFFTTTRRIGADLALVDGANIPLTRGALAEALGGDGELHPSAADYRSDVRRTLFPDMSEQRYDALIQALLQLRTPKLSQHLDPAVVSSLLSRALPPLGQAEISELAEGFERLDRQREQLVKLDAEVDAATQLLGSARRYAQRVLRSSSDAVIKATSTMTKLTREAGESETRHDQAVAERTELDEKQRTAAESAADHAARIEALQASDSYREGQQLDRLREQTRTARDQAEQRQHGAARRRQAATDADQGADQAHQATAARLAAADDARHDAERVAERASMSGTLTHVVDAVDGGVTAGRSLLAAAIESREHQIDDVRQALGTHADSVRDRQRTEEDVRAAVDAEGSAVVDVTAAGVAYDAALGEQERRLAAWADQLTEIRVDRADLLGAVASEPAVGEIVGAAVSRAREGIAGQETSARTVRDEHNRARTDVESELALRRARTELVPDPPATRTADREAMAGAPLWRLVRFADGLDEPTQAGIEAALQASGLLDAWVTPTGGVLLDGGHDIFAIAGAPSAETGGGVSNVVGASGGVSGGSSVGNGNGDAERLAPGRGTLGEVLVAEPDVPVGADVIARLLSSVGYGSQLPSAGTAAISADGRWRLARLTGSWSVSQAAHIGATARERARLARIAALEAQLAQIEAEIAAVDAELDALTQRRRTVAAEQQARPDYHSLNAAEARYRETETRLAAAKERVSVQRGRLADAEAAVAAALRRLSTVAASNGLPAEEQALSRLSRTLGELRTAGDLWLEALSELRHAQARSDTLTDVARRAVEAAAEDEAAAAEAQAQARRLLVQLEAVEGSVSAPYLELLAEIDRERAAHGDAQRSAAALQRSVADLADRIGELRERRRADVEKRDEALAVRDSAAGRFRQLAGSILIEDAGAEVVLTGADGVRATLDAARNLAAVWSGVPYERKNVADAGARLTEAVHQVRELLAERAELEIDTDDDVHLVTAGIDGARLSVAALLDQLRADRDRGQADISAAERELFDKTLTGDTRRHLAARIRQAGELVDRMNHNLTQVRTASNISVKLTWQVDKSLPSGTAAARDLLLKDPVRLRDEDRNALHVFFRERIDEARAANTAASWEQQLAEVFDYTAWHQFLVRIDRRDGNGWQELTKRLHGALSGGEKAIALHLPLFAAVCAYYESVPEAPRLIMLDEVFVGVDAPNRGQVFGLLAALNLDLVLTSDHEWCTYRELPGIAVHQLTRGVDSDDAVTTARFVWTGAALLPDADVGSDAPDGSGEGSLW